ncbi:hypothetical protein, partial [Citrobacter youngae]
MHFRAITRIVGLLVILFSGTMIPIPPNHCSI